MYSNSFLIFGILAASGLHLRDFQPPGMNAILPDYSCPSASGFRNDTVGDFFTASRQFDDPKPLKIEVPETRGEHMCGFSNRNLTENCNCGFLFGWDAANFRSFFFRSVPFASQVIFMDKFKSVIGIGNSTAFNQQPIHAPATMQYALLVQAGLVDKLGIAVGDPLQVELPLSMYFGPSQAGVDDLVGMHT